MPRMLAFVERDHARLFNFAVAKTEITNLAWSKPEHHTHRRDASEKESTQFYETVAGKLANASELIIVGPGIAKRHFMTVLRERHPDLARRVVEVETTDAHLTDGQLQKLAAERFLVADRMAGTQEAR